MRDNITTACAVSPGNSDTQSPDRVSLSSLAYDLANLGIADFKSVRYLANFLLAEPFPTKFLLRSYNRLGNRRIIDVCGGLSLLLAHHSQFKIAVFRRVKHARYLVEDNTRGRWLAQAPSEK